MNIKILCKNIENNHIDFNADRLEELFTEFAKEYHKGQLNLYGVSHQRELLIAQLNKTDLEYIQQQGCTDILADDLLKAINCG